MFRFGIWALIIAPLYAQAYDFPYRDPYYATITAAILKADHLDRSIHYQDLSLRLRPERDGVPFFGPRRNKITVRYWKQQEEAPLIVLVSGLGGAASATYNNYLGSLFQKRGFAVLALPSPFHFSFALAGSRSGLPGITREDARDLYEAISAGLEKLGVLGAQVKGLGLIGISMGALEAAYLSQIDAEEGKLGFQRVLLLNPPVDPLYSGQALDTLEQAGSKISSSQKKELREKVYLFGSQALMMNDIKSPSYFLGIEQALPTTLEERQYLIGSSLKVFLQSLVYATQQVEDLGVLPGEPTKEHLEERMKASAGFTFRDYLERILLPGLKRKLGRDISPEEMARHAGIEGVAAHLAANPNILVLHNRDDFIVNEAQLGRLREILGGRLKVYPNGGHVGNVWFKENLAEIFGWFESL